MTNEEIDEETQLLCDLLALCDSAEKEGETIGLFLRRLVSQAYEEAAKIADEVAGSYLRTLDPSGIQAETGCNIAAGIRGLKDSLVQEPVSST